MNNYLLYILAAALATILTRFLPYWLLKKKTENHLLLHLQKTSGLLIMAILTIYAMKTLNYPKLSYVFIAFFSLSLAFVLHIWKKNFLLSMVIPTLSYMFLIRVITI